MAVPRTTHPLRGGAAPGIAEARGWIGSRVIDAGGAGVGRLTDVWTNDQNGEPEWLLLREGRFSGGAHKLAPFAGATGGGGQVWLPFTRAQIRSSPRVRVEELITPALGKRLREHYELDRSPRSASRRP